MEVSFKAAEAYYKEYGNLYVPSGYSFNGVLLAIWLTSQRGAYKKNLLSKDRIKRLESIGMDWNGDATKRNKWEAKYNYAKMYYETHGNLIISRSYTINEVRLGAWIATQRYQYNKQKLSVERIELLENIGMVWKIR